MGMLDRLGNVIKSYLNDYSEGQNRGERLRQGRSDPDYNAAYEELDDFLNKKDKQSGGETSKEASKGSSGHNRVPPESLNKDFEELGLSPDASFEECKAAYKSLLKIHHPDKHSGHENNMKKATEKSARVNTAYRRLEDWFRRTD